MKISIVLCTYNGKKYIIEQLESLKNQTRIPDEVLIFDDLSMDGTPDIISEYIKINKLNWELKINQTNKGWKRNFTDAFKQTRGDIIFCCDQDDIWYPNKIKVMEEALKDKNRKLVACKVEMVDDCGKSIKKILGAMPKSKESGRIRKIDFDHHFYISQEPGCAIAFKREILDLYLKFWSEVFPHDQLLWIVSKYIDGAYEIDSKLLDYRRSESSVFEKSKTARSSVNRRKKITDLEKKISVVTKLVSKEDKKKIKIVNIAYEWIKERKQLVDNFKISEALCILTKIKFYNPGLLYLVDCYDGIKNLYNIKSK